jgi:hypothetical protein
VPRGAAAVVELGGRWSRCLRAPLEGSLHDVLVEPRGW